MNGMALVACVAIAVAFIVLVVSLGFVRWALRSLERRDRALEQLRLETVERYARLVGQQIEATPRERQAERAAALHQARRELASTRIVEDPEQAVEMPSPTEARYRERLVYEELAERAGVASAEELLADAPDATAREPLVVDFADVGDTL